MPMLYLGDSVPWGESLPSPGSEPPPPYSPPRSELFLPFYDPSLFPPRFSSRYSSETPLETKIPLNHSPTSAFSPFSCHRMSPTKYPPPPYSAVEKVFAPHSFDRERKVRLLEDSPETKQALRPSRQEAECLFPTIQKVPRRFLHESKEKRADRNLDALIRRKQSPAREAMHPQGPLLKTGKSLELPFDKRRVAPPHSGVHCHPVAKTEPFKADKKTPKLRPLEGHASASARHRVPPVRLAYVGIQQDHRWARKASLLEEEAARSMTSARARLVRVTRVPSIRGSKPPSYASPSPEDSTCHGRLRTYRSLDELSDLLEDDPPPEPAFAATRSLDDLTEEALYVNVSVRRKSPCPWAMEDRLNRSVPDILEKTDGGLGQYAGPRKNSLSSLVEDGLPKTCPSWCPSGPASLPACDSVTDINVQLEKIRHVARVLGDKVQRGELTPSSHCYISSPAESCPVTTSSPRGPPSLPARAPVIHDASSVFSRPSLSFPKPSSEADASSQESGYSSVDSRHSSQSQRTPPPPPPPALPPRKHCFKEVAKQGINQDQLGIYIKSVVPGGAADQDGRLQAGDQLLSVDGKSLIGISQERAAEHMMDTGPVVTLEVARQGALYHGLATVLSQPSPQVNRGYALGRPEREIAGKAKAVLHQPEAATHGHTHPQHQLEHPVAGRPLSSLVPPHVQPRIQASKSVPSLNSDPSNRVGTGHEVVNPGYSRTSSSTSLSQPHHHHAGQMPHQPPSHLSQPHQHQVPMRSRSTQNLSEPSPLGARHPSNPNLTPDEERHYQNVSFHQVHQDPRMGSQRGPRPSIAALQEQVQHRPASAFLQREDIVQRPDFIKFTDAADPRRLDDRFKYNRLVQNPRQDPTLGPIPSSLNMPYRAYRSFPQGINTYPGSSNLQDQQLAFSAGTPLRHQAYLSQPHVEYLANRQPPPTAPKPRSGPQDVDSAPEKPLRQYPQAGPHAEGPPRPPPPKESPPPPPPPASTHPLLQQIQGHARPSIPHPLLNGVRATNPWEREERYRHDARRKEAVKQWRDEQIAHLEELGRERSQQQDERLRTLLLEREFQRRAEEALTRGEDEDDDEDYDSHLHDAHERCTPKAAHDVEAIAPDSQKAAGDSQQTFEEPQKVLNDSHKSQYDLQKERTQDSQKMAVQDTPTRSLQQQQQQQHHSWNLVSSQANIEPRMNGGGPADEDRSRKMDEIRRKQQELEAAREAEESILREAQRRQEEDSRLQQAFQHQASQRLDTLVQQVPHAQYVNGPANGLGIHFDSTPVDVPLMSPMSPLPPERGSSLSVMLAAGQYRARDQIGGISPKRVQFPETPTSETVAAYDADQQDKMRQSAPNNFLSDSESSFLSTPTVRVGNTPGVIGAQEVYRDPRLRRLQEQKEKAMTTAKSPGPEKLTFKEKMKMFARETGEQETPKDKVKTSRAQRDIEHPVLSRGDS